MLSVIKLAFIYVLDVEKKYTARKNVRNCIGLSIKANAKALFALKLLYLALSHLILFQLNN